MNKYEEKNRLKQELIELKQAFNDKGVLVFPRTEIERYAPYEDRELWMKRAQNVWNLRSTKFDTYLIIFKHIYKEL